MFVGVANMSSYCFDEGVADKKLQALGYQIDVLCSCVHGYTAVVRGKGTGKYWTAWGATERIARTLAEQKAVGSLS